MSALPEVFRRLPIAHRALHDVTAGRPENSREAIRAAIAAGYGIEIDLQPSRDGRAMVFHDYDLGRLTPETGPVRGRDAAELAQIPLRGGEAGIPDLPEVLTLVAGRVPLLIELKDQHGQMGVTDGVLEAATAEALAGYKGLVALMSFNLREETRARLRAIPDYERAGASFVSHDVTDLANPRLAELRAQGAAILCWTVRSRETEARARQVADNITFERYLADIPA
jgi:glycerophosphoryl diester phosphodiesterase